MSFCSGAPGLGVLPGCPHPGRSCSHLVSEKLSSWMIEQWTVLKRTWDIQYKDKQIWRQCRGRVPVQEFSISCMFSHLEISFFFMLLTDFKFPFIHFTPFLNWDQKVVPETKLTVTSWEEGPDVTPRGSLGFLQPPVHLFGLWEETGVEPDLTRPAVRHLR